MSSCTIKLWVLCDLLSVFSYITHSSGTTQGSNSPNSWSDLQISGGIVSLLGAGILNSEKSNVKVSAPSSDSSEWQPMFRSSLLFWNPWLEVNLNMLTVSDIANVSQKKLLKNSKFEGWQQQLGLRDVWRCHGRLHNTGLSEDMKHLILNKGHHLAVLVVRECHTSEFVRRLLNGLRNSWQHDSKSLSGRPPSSLPDFRMQSSSPFTTTGLTMLVCCT